MHDVVLYARAWKGDAEADPADPEACLVAQSLEVNGHEVVTYDGAAVDVTKEGWADRIPDGVTLGLGPLADHGGGFLTLTIPGASLELRSHFPPDKHVEGTGAGQLVLPVRSFEVRPARVASPSLERIGEWIEGAKRVLSDDLPAGHALWKSWALDLADQVLALAHGGPKVDARVASGPKVDPRYDEARGWNPGPGGPLPDRGPKVDE